MLVLVRPCYPDFLKDKLFSREHHHAAHWMEPYVVLKEQAAARGIEIHTWDMEPLENADVIIFQDLPKRSDVEAARQKAPHAALILQILESPLARPYAFVRQNHNQFSAILTYNHHLCDEKRYFHYFLPIGDSQPATEGLPFSGRRPCVIINTNRNLGLNGLMAPRESGGMAGLPGIGVWFRGWSVPLSRWIRQTQGELYSSRRKIARLAEKDFPGILDIYGSGWSGERVSWAHRFLRPHAFSNVVASRNECKIDILRNYRFCIAFENIQGDFGYISEKIFDAFLAGTVPIYLGDKYIAQYVPSSCFVDANRFDSHRDLLRYVRDCPEAEWFELRRNGGTFIRSTAAVPFFSDCFATKMLDVISIAVTQTSATGHAPKQLRIC
jgi:hypothetical protein